MLRALRERKTLVKWILGGALGIMSVSMVFMLGFGGLNNESGGSNAALATIGGQKITADALRQTIDQAMQSSQNGYDPSLIPLYAEPAFDQMLRQDLLIYAAKRMGFRVTKQEVYQYLQTRPWLYQKGKYIGAAAASEVIEDEFHESAPEFEQQVSDVLLTNKLRDAISDAVQVTPAEIEAEFIRQDTKAKIEYVTFDPSTLLNDVKVTPAALAAYFALHQTQYQQPEERQIRYVLIGADQVASMDAVSDQEVQQYYAAHVDNYRVPNRVKVAEILFKTDGKTPAEIAADKKLAAKVEAKIRAGAKFSDMAQEYSEDASASNGGLIGWIVRGQAVKQFEDTAFALNPGQVSGVVTSSYGIYIIKVLDKQTAHLQTFDEVKSQIRASLEQQKRAQAEQTVASKLQSQLSLNPLQFAAIAQKAGLSVSETPVFQLNQPVPDFGSSKSFQNLAFQLQLNEVGGPITVPMGVAVIQAEKIIPPHTPKLAEVQAQVTEDYRAAESKVLALEKAKAFAAAAQKGNFDKLAKAQGLKPATSKDFSRDDYVDGVGQASTIPAAFTLPVGGTSGAIPEPNNGVDIVFSVVSHTPADLSQLPAKRNAIANQLLQQKRELAFDIFESNLKKRLLRSGKLKLNQAAFQQFIDEYSKS